MRRKQLFSFSFLIFLTFGLSLILQYEFSLLDVFLIWLLFWATVIGLELDSRMISKKMSISTPTPEIELPSGLKGFLIEIFGFLLICLLFISGFFFWWLLCIFFKSVSRSWWIVILIGIDASAFGMQYLMTLISIRIFGKKRQQTTTN